MYLIFNRKKMKKIKEMDALEEKLDNFVKEMNELKSENAKIIEMQMNSNRKMLKLESENEDLKNENSKYRLKLESLQKDIFQNEVVKLNYCKN